MVDFEGEMNTEEVQETRMKTPEEEAKDFLVKVDSLINDPEQIELNGNGWEDFLTVLEKTGAKVVPMDSGDLRNTRIRGCVDLPDGTFLVYVFVENPEEGQWGFSFNKYPSISFE